MEASVSQTLPTGTEPLPAPVPVRAEALQGADINQAKILLANEATRLLHGADAAAQAEETARRTFAEAGSGEALPRMVVDAASLAVGLPLIDALTQLGLTASKAEARRLIKQGGARVNGEAVADELHRLGMADADDAGEIRLSAGKKRHGVVVLG